MSVYDPAGYTPTEAWAESRLFAHLLLIRSHGQHQQAYYHGGELRSSIRIITLIRTWIRTVSNTAHWQDPTAAQGDLGNDSEMWNMFLDEVKEEDNRIKDSWKEDASSIVVFVSLNYIY